MPRKLLLPALAALLLAACAAKPSYQPPVLVQSVRAPYPSRLEEEGISGHARVQMRIDTEGKVRAVRVLSATHPLFARSAERAASRLLFTPAKRNGQPAESSVIQTFRFISPQATTDTPETAQPPHPPLPTR